MNPAAGSLQSRLLTWFARNGRDLPWRHTRDPYAILVSEIMLQQTQVDRVLPKYAEFLERFPTFRDLAAAPVAEVIRSWAPLGYNQRAVRLHRLAQEVMTEHGGALPDDAATLGHMTGIGPYTAAAVSCFAFGGQTAVIDTNVRRVLGRYAFGNANPNPAELAALAKEALPRGKAWEWNQALMDIGSLFCLSGRPRCAGCPARDGCRASEEFTRENTDLRGMNGSARTLKAAEVRTPYSAGTRQTVRKAEPFKGSNRYYRGHILALLRELTPGESVPLSTVGSTLDLDETRLADLAAALAHDGLVRQDGTTLSLP